MLWKLTTYLRDPVRYKRVEHKPDQYGLDQQKPGQRTAQLSWIVFFSELTHQNCLSCPTLTFQYPNISKNIQINSIR